MDLIALAPARPSALWTDRYKLLMAEAGFAIRPERFVLSFRRGGPTYVPLDLAAWVQALRPTPPTAAELDWVATENGLPMGPGYRHALQKGELEVSSAPAGSWVAQHEPLCVVSGPSALVSTVEATLIGTTAFLLQVATLGKKAVMGLLSREDLQRRLGRVSCDQEREIVGTVLESVGAPAVKIQVESEAYQESVAARAHTLVQQVEGGRIAEGGLRSATCPEQHRLAVEAAAQGGIRATSNVQLARELGLRAVGTTGHEHCQRHFSDLAAFEAAADRIPGDVTLLLDTYDTLSSGIPRALEVMERWRGRTLSARPDNESTQERDVRAMVQGMAERGLDGGIALSGGFDAERTARFEALRRELGRPAHSFSYLYGSHLVRTHIPELPTRSDASAVFKLCESAGRPTMKLSSLAGGAPGPKSSKPGRPTIFRAQVLDGSRPPSLIGQHGETPPAGYAPLQARELSAAELQVLAQGSQDSARTTSLVKRCLSERAASIQAQG
ncbi:MAG: nicotinate phosphoribosyltransferase [Myxococcota bacterium]|nr:nicotinate phosphoribosyltransferase [Myxococcota bacterium]